jgi:hypothetical protein
MSKLFKRKRPLSASEIGLLQTFGLIVYLTLVAGALNYLGKGGPTGITAVVLGLALFVFSAAVTGSLTFGYPAVLAIRGHVREALRILAYTLLYFLAIIFLLVAVVFITA